MTGRIILKIIQILQFKHSGPAQDFHMPIGAGLNFIYRNIDSAFGREIIGEKQSADELFEPVS